MQNNTESFRLACTKIRNYLSLTKYQTRSIDIFDNKKLFITNSGIDVLNTYMLFATIVHTAKRSTYTQKVSEEQLGINMRITIKN